MQDKTPQSKSFNPSRAQQFALFFTFASFLWTFCIIQLNIFPEKLRFFVKIFPLWFIVTIGAISLGNIGWHLWTFGDCPDAYLELQQQIVTAKKDLTSKGFKFD